MTYRVKVNQSSGPRYYYALGAEGLNALLDLLYAGGPINLVLSRIA